MADLIAIGYPDEATAQAAADEARRLAQDLIIQPDAIAVISRDTDGGYHVTTNHHSVGAGATWGMFWGFLFGLLFFIPVFGMAIGAGMGALMGKLAKTSIDKQFQEQVRRHRPEDLAVQGGRGRTAGGAARDRRGRAVARLITRGRRRPAGLVVRQPCAHQASSAAPAYPT